MIAKCRYQQPCGLDTLMAVSQIFFRFRTRGVRHWVLRLLILDYILDDGASSARKPAVQASLYFSSFVEKEHGCRPLTSLSLISRMKSVKFYGKRIVF